MLTRTHILRVTGDQILHDLRVVLLRSHIRQAPRDYSAIRRAERFGVGRGCERLPSLCSLAGQDHIRTAHRHEALPSLQAWCAHRKMDSGIRRPPPDGPNLTPTAEVVLLELAGR